MSKLKGSIQVLSLKKILIRSFLVTLTIIEIFKLSIIYQNSPQYVSTLILLALADKKNWLETNESLVTNK